VLAAEYSRVFELSPDSGEALKISLLIGLEDF
jgi:hypothetical protein